MKTKLQADILEFLTGIAEYDICDDRCDGIEYCDLVNGKTVQKKCYSGEYFEKFGKDVDLRKIVCGHLAERITAMRLIDRLKQEE